MPHRRQVIAGLAAAAAAPAIAPAAQARELPAMPEGFVGSPGDFDFFKGRWTCLHRTLRPDGGWNAFEGTTEFRTLMDGIANVDENHMPSKGSMGVSFRTLDIKHRRWSIYWVNSATGLLQVPVHGGFQDGRGEFYGEDIDDKGAFLARYTWLPDHPDGPHWEQAYSRDRGQTWETNWTMDFRPL